ncbi:hypothetical protein [Streptosporangium sp. NPDC048865]|uniref:hypothetical protein n=1 Tax=Streptosporangium sp. NPDC048865 TaxID=3155766 RepID=UPI003436485D
MVGSRGTGTRNAAQEAAAAVLLAVFADVESDDFDEDESDELDESDDFDEDEPEESEELEELDEPFADVTVLDDEDRLSVR